ncbi:MAG: PAS domain-containing protein [Anaerolineales bacterium]|nr:PAS domain-containing protein [Anaerolineales bacterium]
MFRTARLAENGRTMNRFFDRILNVAVDDPREFRRRRLINITLLGIVACAAIGLVYVRLAPALTAEDQHAKMMLTRAIVSLFPTMTIIYFVNRRSGNWAAFLFLAISTLFVYWLDAPQELANGRSTFVFTIPIAASSLILFPSASFIFAAISAAYMFWAASVATPPVQPSFFALIGFFMLALITWLATRSLEQVLRELQTLNLNLDHLAEEKTQELAQTLVRAAAAAGRNQAILDSIADGVIVFDSQNNAILANPALSRLINIPVNDLINHSMADFISRIGSDDKRTMQSVFEEREKTLTGIRVQSENKTLSASIARVTDAERKSIGSVAVFRDVTREAELEKMKDTFVGVVSHELRTPLNAVLGYAEMLKEGVYGAINEKQSAIAERMMNSTKRLLTIVGELLDQAQIQSGKLKIIVEPCRPVELLDSLHGVMEQLATKKGLDLQTDLASDMPQVIMGDSHRLHQVLINLVGNAIKFTDKGFVNVRIQPEDAQRWQIRVSDSGGGIAAEAQELVFESFRQADASAVREHGGVGLGLSIVKQLVELMKGSIRLESEIGKGSAFIVSLPLVADITQTQPKIAPPQKENA